MTIQEIQSTIQDISKFIDLAMVNFQKVPPDVLQDLSKLDEDTKLKINQMFSICASKANTLKV